LHVLGRRADGYHDLDSLVVFADVGDLVEVRPADTWRLAVTGPFAGALRSVADNDNLAMRAARLLLREAGRDQALEIRLDKCIPLGAGFGGGSADAAAVLHATNRCLQLGYSTADLQSVGLALGADVPVCVHGGPAYFGGIGEVVTAVVLPPLHLCLAWPGVGLATAAVFRDAEPHADVERAATPRSFADVVTMMQGTTNDLVARAEDLLPVIKDVLAALMRQRGCAAARMSGSGSGCFGIFADTAAAAAAAQALRAEHAAWWTATATTLPE